MTRGTSQKRSPFFHRSSVFEQGDKRLSLPSSSLHCINRVRETRSRERKKKKKKNIRRSRFLRLSTREISRGEGKRGGEGKRNNGRHSNPSTRRARLELWQSFHGRRDPPLGPRRPLLIPQDNDNIIRREGERERDRLVDQRIECAGDDKTIEATIFCRASCSCSGPACRIRPTDRPTDRSSTIRPKIPSPQTSLSRFSPSPSLRSFHSVTPTPFPNVRPIVPRDRSWCWRFIKFRVAPWTNNGWRGIIIFVALFKRRRPFWPAA